ncbi:MAG: hypothetical protein ACW99Q_26875, partial [Candidatus Kariarchaeaceae archaeon]
MSGTSGITGSSGKGGISSGKGSSSGGGVSSALTEIPAKTVATIKRHKKILDNFPIALMLNSTYICNITSPRKERLKEAVRFTLTIHLT